MIYFILFFLFFLLLLFRIFLFTKKRKEFHTHEEAVIIDEVEEYTSEADLYKKEESETSDSDGIVDPYSRKKKGGYQTKTYRGTDIETAGFEDENYAYKKSTERKDEAAAKKLLEENKLEVEEDEVEIPQVQPIDPKELESGIAGDEARIQTMNVEIKQNYRAKSEVSGIANESNTVGRLKKIEESKQNKGGEISR